MPELTWVGKDKVKNHHHDVPFHLLKKQYVFQANSDKPHNRTDNILIHGDNLTALKSLLPEFGGRVNCIYIDPPYNTGNENWVYNDNVNDPHIQKWLGEVVGKNGEDFSRHDKWLCMMYPRLKLLKQLLAEDGVIFISIDDNEIGHLKMICDEIFNASNFIDIFSWVKTETPANLSNKSKKSVEYILCYQKERNNKKFRGLQKNSKSSNGLMNQANAEKTLIFPANKIDTSLQDGVYKAGKYGTKKYQIDLLEDTEVQSGYFIKPVVLKGKFKWTQGNLNKEIQDGTKVSIKTSAFSPSYERTEYDPEVPCNLINKNFGVNTNEDASKTLNEIFGDKVFDYPKPTSLIKYLIGFNDNPNAIILDSFSGSGTTAHAVLSLNQQDNGNRRFICIEMMDYAETITAERIRRVINGYGIGKESVNGVGGGFSFYTVGESLFLDDNLQNINENALLADIRQYIAYTEALSSLWQIDNALSPYALGYQHGTAYVFYYEKDCVTTLDLNFLQSLNANGIDEKPEQWVIYADKNTLSETQLKHFNIVFKRIPRDISKI